MCPDQIITPTFIDDLAFAFDQIIQNNLSGIYHTSGSDSLSPFEITRKIADIFGFDKTLISETTSVGNFIEMRARRPSNLALKNDKIVKLGSKHEGNRRRLTGIKKTIMTITFVGHGYVGLVTASIFADLGNKVWVIGHTKEKIENLKGHYPIYEPGLEEIVKRNVKAGRLLFTLDYDRQFPNLQ